MSDSADKLAQTLRNLTNGMAPEQKKQFDRLFMLFALRLRNSPNFKAKCDRLAACGISPLTAWLDEHNFEW